MVFISTLACVIFILFLTFFCFYIFVILSAKFIAEQSQNVSDRGLYFKNNNNSICIAP